MIGNVGSDEVVERIIEAAAGNRTVSISGLTSIAAKAFVLAKLREKLDRPLVILAESNSDLETFCSDIRFHSPGSAIVALPSFETDIYSGSSPHAETQEIRAMALWQIAHAQPDFLVISPRSLIARTSSPEEIKQLGRVMRIDEDIPPDELVEQLLSAGFVREDPINNYGQFSVRGGILDVWSPDAANPVRIEFFGDTVDSIRSFDSETQLSTGQLKEIRIAPMREFSASADDFRLWAELAKERFADEIYARNLKDLNEFAENGEPFPGWEFLIPISDPRSSTVFDFLDKPLFIIDEPQHIESTLKELYSDLNRRFEHLSETGEIGLAPTDLFIDAEELRELLDNISRFELSRTRTRSRHQRRRDRR